MLTNTINWNQRLRLLEFVKAYHEGQKRKYTQEPYWHHCLVVGFMADKYDCLGFEVGICHDLFEDTSCDRLQLSNVLDGLGYTSEQTEIVVSAVQELTNEFTAEKYPGSNRKQRKLRELDRLKTISALAQTVKYCDIIHNVSSIVKHDPSFSVVYLAEKEAVLTEINGGNPSLYIRCWEEVQKQKAGLKPTLSKKGEDSGKESDALRILKHEANGACEVCGKDVHLPVSDRIDYKDGYWLFCNCIESNIRNGGKTIHIPIEGIDAHITWSGQDPPSKETLYSINQMAKKAFKMFEVSPKQLEQIERDHD